MTTPKIEFHKLSHSSPVAIFSLYGNVYQHVSLYRDFTNDGKEKSQCRPW